MPVVQTRNADKSLLNSADLLRSSDRNFVFEAYHNSSNTFTSEQVLGLDIERLNHAPEYFDLASNILTVLTAGVFLFNIRSTFLMTGGGAGQVALYLQEDPDTGTFTTVPVTVSYVYLPAALNASAQIVVPLLVNFDYRYRIAAVRTSGGGNVQTVSQTTTLSALLLYNNAG